VCGFHNCSPHSSSAADERSFLASPLCSPRYPLGEKKKESGE
jgi:hypothetical protein